MNRATLLLALLLATPAAAHDAPTGWSYPAVCCQGIAGPGGHGDCQKIAGKTVKIVTGGYQITLAPGDHMLATKPHVFFVPYAEVKQSQDEDFHLCLYPTEDMARCFFAPPMSF